MVHFIAFILENQRTVIVQAQYTPETQVKKPRLESETQNPEISTDSTG